MGLRTIPFPEGTKECAFCHGKGIIETITWIAEDDFIRGPDEECSTCEGRGYYCEEESDSEPLLHVQQRCLRHE